VLKTKFAYIVLQHLLVWLHCFTVRLLLFKPDVTLNMGSVNEIDTC